MAWYSMVEYGWHGWTGRKREWTVTVLECSEAADALPAKEHGELVLELPVGLCAEVFLIVRVLQLGAVGHVPDKGSPGSSKK